MTNYQKKAFKSSFFALVFMALLFVRIPNGYPVLQMLHLLAMGGTILCSILLGIKAFKLRMQDIFGEDGGKDEDGVS